MKKCRSRVSHVFVSTSKFSPVVLQRWPAKFDILSYHLPHNLKSITFETTKNSNRTRYTNRITIILAAKSTSAFFQEFSLYVYRNSAQLFNFFSIFTLSTKFLGDVERRK